jgi:hypothetical protein
MAKHRITELRVPFDRYAKLAAKGISVDDVREVLENPETEIRRGPKNTRPDQEGRCYFLIGKPEHGRTLKVLIRRLDDGAAILITAW